MTHNPTSLTITRSGHIVTPEPGVTIHLLNLFETEGGRVVTQYRNLTPGLVGELVDRWARAGEDKHT